MKNLVVFGTLPPPIGGVTISVKNVVTALRNVGADVQMFSLSSLLSIRRFDISHINYSKKWKILVALLISKLISKHSVFVIHGNDFCQRNIINKMSLKLADTIIALNQQVKDRLDLLHPNKVLIHSPLYKEGIDSKDTSFDNNYTLDDVDKVTLLIYINDRVYIDSNDVYGLPFFIENLEEKFHAVILDIKGLYKDEIKDLSSITYIDRPVDFIELLKKVDIYVRPTSNDGSSVAILEAISQGVKVLASDVVDRPDGIETYSYNNAENYREKLNKLAVSNNNNPCLKLTSIHDLIDLG